MEIAGKTVLITGANRGIGRALVEEALKRGARKVYAGTRSTLWSEDPRLSPLKLDVTNATDIERVAALVDELDVLVNNAGIAAFDDLADPELIERHFAVNVFGTLKLTQALAPQLAGSKGAVVNVASLVALAPLPLMSAYSISKAAAFNMTLSLRAHLARKRVSVHAVVLGPVDTDMARGLNIPKATPAAVALGIFDGLANGEEEIFPDPASAEIADAWRAGLAKAMERQMAGFVRSMSADAA